jgi:NitT/TauT family transport system substrate-binding protein
MRSVLARSALCLGAFVATFIPVARTNARALHALKHVILATGFMPNVEFAPYYVAQDLGYYEAQGLDVEMNYDRTPTLLQDVVAGRYTFATSSGDSVAIARSTGIKVTYVAAQYQKYPVGAMALKSTGITLTGPTDLRGKNIGISIPGSATDIGLQALLKAGGMTEKDITKTAIGFTETQALIAGQIDVAMTYIDNEPVQAAALGHPVSVLPVSKYVKLISNGVVASTQLVKKHPGLIQRFVTATLKGLRYTITHPNKAFTISMKRQPEITDPAQIKIQRDVLAERLRFQKPPTGHPLGWSNPADWKTTITFLRSIGSIKRSITVKSIYTDAFTNTFASKARA